MSAQGQGLKHLKACITIAAPAEDCYLSWHDARHFPEFMKRVYAFRDSHEPECSPEKIYEKALDLTKGRIPASTIRHWILSGPGGKLYEVENAIVLDIPYYFFCTVSTDPNDIAFYTSTAFSPDESKRNTFVEFHISFWNLNREGKWTELALAILESGDSFLEDILKDFKTQLEKGRSAP